MRLPLTHTGSWQRPGAAEGTGHSHNRRVLWSFVHFKKKSIRRKWACDHESLPKFKPRSNAIPGGRRGAGTEKPVLAAGISGQGCAGARAQGVCFPHGSH